MTVKMKDTNIIKYAKKMADDLRRSSSEDADIPYYRHEIALTLEELANSLVALDEEE